MIRRVADETSEGILLQVEEAGGTLNVRKAFRVLELYQFIPPAAHEAESQLAKQFPVVKLANAKEIHDLAVQVVQHFHLRGFLVEENLGAARKRLNIGGVLRKNLNDLLG
jgi:hypothetical protein